MREPEGRMAIWKILLAVGIMAVGVYAVGETLRKKAPTPEPHISTVERILSAQRAEQGRLLSTSLSPDMPVQPGVKARSLQAYYALRAYAEAPPVIPHEVDAEIAQTMNCNVCHAQGGYAPKFNAYAPVTPHPQYENCMQCHVESGDDPLFAQTAWQRARPPQVRRSALPGGPPPIPHTLQLRDNCLSCHAGPAAVAEVRTTHPERVNCVQCHVPRTVPDPFERAARPGGE